MKARVAKVVAPCKIAVFDEEMPEPGEGEFLVRVIACGLCHSDVPYYRGKKEPARAGHSAASPPGGVRFPYAFGHELNGVVVSVGPGVRSFKVGDKVGGLVFGSYATHVMCREGRVGRIPDGVCMETALAEPLMCITNILRAANPEIGDYVAVVGAGFMGLLTVAGLRSCPVREVIAIDLVDERLEQAKKMGATKTVNPRQQDVIAAIEEITGGHGVDVAIDITGRYAGLSLATKIIKVRRGKILCASLYTEPEMIDIGQEMLSKVPIIHSVHPGYSYDYVRDMEVGLWAAKVGILPIEKLITHRFSLDELNEAFEMLTTNPPGFIKGVVVME